MISNGIATQRVPSPQVRRPPASANLYDILDLILDKGIVIDAYVRVSLIGIELLTVDLRVVIASVDTYLRYAEAVESMSSLRNPEGSTNLPKMVGEATQGPVSRIANRVKEVVTGGGDGRQNSAQPSGRKEVQSEQKKDNNQSSTFDNLAKGAGAAVAGAVAAGIPRAVSKIAGKFMGSGGSRRSGGSRKRAHAGRR